MKLTSLIRGCLIGATLIVKRGTQKKGVEEGRKKRGEKKKFLVQKASHDPLYFHTIMSLDTIILKEVRNTIKTELKDT